MGLRRAHASATERRALPIALVLVFCDVASAPRAGPAPSTSSSSAARRAHDSYK